MAHTTSPIWGVVLKVLVKKGPLEIHFINGNPGILTKQGTYIMAILGTGILDNHQFMGRV